MIGYPDTLQSHGHERIGTFAGPWVGWGDDSGWCSTRPSPVWPRRAHGLPAHVHGLSGPPPPAARLIASRGWRAFGTVSPRPLPPASVEAVRDDCASLHRRWGHRGGEEGIGNPVPPVEIDFPFEEAATATWKGFLPSDEIFWGKG